MIDLDELERLAREATPGPWFFDSYSAVKSEPVTLDLHVHEEALDDDSPDEEWDALPEPLVASVPVARGDTATTQGAVDARFIAAANPAVVLELVGEVRRLREQLQEKRELEWSLLQPIADEDGALAVLAGALAALADHAEPEDSEEGGGGCEVCEAIRRVRGFIRGEVTAVMEDDDD